MTRFAMSIARKALSSVALNELVVAQVKRQIDDSEGDGKPFLPLWADKVGFKVDGKGRATMVDAPLLRKLRRDPKRLAKYLRQLKKITGTSKRIARQLIRAIRSVRHSSAKLPGKRTKKARTKIYYSYRRSGKPLLDTRIGYSSIHGRTSGVWPEKSVTIRAPLYMIYQHHGFTTAGPNFIPLSLLAKRTHQKGANPHEEGLRKGIDYWIFRKGVTVPARPFAKLGPKYLRRLARTLYLDMKAHNG